jgi:putative flippase GtrA
MSKRVAREAVAYISVAGAAAVSDWIIFALISWLSPARDVVFAQAVARLTGGLVAFALHRTWSFREQQGLGLTTEAGRFLALYVFSFCVSLGTVYVLVDMLDFNRYLSKAFADTLCFIVNFIVMKLWVFNASPTLTKVAGRSGGTE